jgi:hypothetical protein
MKQMHPADKAALAGLVLLAVVLLLLFLWVRGGSRTHTTGLGRGAGVVAVLAR